MKNNAFEQLEFFLNKSLRLKLTSRNSLFSILSVLTEFIDYNVFSQSEFKKFSIINLSIITREIYTLREFENDLLIFLSSNQEITNFLKDQGIDLSIIKTHSIYYEEILYSLDQETEFNTDKFERKIKEFMEILTEEIKVLLRFRQEVNTQIKNLQLCYVCLIKGEKNFALFECKKCNRKLCDEHKMPGNMCLECLNEYFNEEPDT